MNHKKKIGSKYSKHRKKGKLKIQRQKCDANASNSNKSIENPILNDGKNLRCALCFNALAVVASNIESLHTYLQWRVKPIKSLYFFVVVFGYFDGVAYGSVFFLAPIHTGKCGIKNMNGIQSKNVQALFVTTTAMCLCVGGFVFNKSK